MIGSKQITQKELAKLANVSQSVISLVLNNSPLKARIPQQTRNRVLEIARQHNYRVNPVARQLRSGQSRLINVVSPVVFSHERVNMIPLIETELSRAGYHIMISRLDSEVKNIVETLRTIMTFGFAGTIALDLFEEYVPPKGQPSVCQVLSEYNNVIFLQCPADVEDFTAVEVDYAAGVTEAVRELVARGRRRIALALNDDYRPSMIGRLQGYRRGLESCGLPYDPQLCWVAESAGMIGLDGSRPEHFAEHFDRQLLIGRNADAIITSNDEWAVAVIHVVRRRGVSVPEELSVVGYGDNPDLCWACEPELTSISHGNIELAVKLAGRLLSSLAGVTVGGSEVVKSYLVVRNSL